MMNGRGDEIKAPSPLGRCNHTVQGSSVVKIDCYLSADEYVWCRPSDSAGVPRERLWPALEWVCDGEDWAR